MKKTIIITSLIVTFLSIFGPSCFAQPSETTRELYAQGQVNEVTEKKIEIKPDNPLYDPTKEQSQFHTIQNVTFEVLEGEYKGTIFESTNEITGQIYDIYLEKGDKVMLFLRIDGEQIEGYATDFIRNNTMIIFVALFFLGLILLGKMKGVKALISLLVTIGSIFFILIPLTIQGYDALLIATCVSVVISLITITLIAGVNKKALSAIIGTVFGVLCAALIAYFIGNISLLTGLSGEDARILYINRPELNFSHIFFASIMIGALGAVMDVGMSIASSVNEIYLANKTISGNKLFEAGMKVGKDIMGTMSNTLILAYVGSSFPLLLLFAMDNFDFMHVINFDFIAAEIVRSISGSFGLLLAIPVTALAGSLLIRKRS